MSFSWYWFKKCCCFWIFIYWLNPAWLLAEEVQEVQEIEKTAEPQTIEAFKKYEEVKESATIKTSAETDSAEGGVEKAEENPEGETIVVSGKTYLWIASSRRYVGKAVKKMTGSVDNYLSKDSSIVENKSFLRLRLGYAVEEGGHGYPHNDIKFKIDLPKTENRWSLIFETDPDEFETLEQQEQDSKAKEQAFETTDGSIGAVKFILNDWRYWKSDFDVGVKTPLPLNPFVRFNMSRRYEVTENWTARIKHSIYYFNQEGFGERSTLVFERPLFVDWTFFNVNNMRWQEIEQVLEFSEVVTFQHRLTERDTFLYRTGIFYQEHPDPHTQSYFVDTIYRRRLYEHWLFGELIPSVTWAEANNFQSLAALTFRLEIIFD